MVPSPGNPQSLNRYSYGLNNPLKYVDPTGHAAGPWWVQRIMGGLAQYLNDMSIGLNNHDIVGRRAIMTSKGH
jgi:hypothetical protein